MSPQQSPARPLRRALAVATLSVAALSAGGYALSAQAATSPSPAPTVSTKRTATPSPAEPATQARRTATPVPTVDGSDPSEARPARPVAGRPSFTG